MSLESAKFCKVFESAGANSVEHVPYTWQLWRLYYVENSSYGNQADDVCT
jgi:hypothetical protein